MSAATISSAAPDATTASLAADVPIEHTTISSVAPESSTAELTAQTVSTPDPSDVPGGFPETPGTEIAEYAPIIEEGQVFSVKPFPASDIPTNPFHLEPGEPIPQNEFTTADINKHVKLDEESYQRVDASNLGFGLNGTPVLPGVVTPAAVQEAEGRGVLDIPLTAADTIPESSLPITSFAATVATPGALGVVEESQEKTGIESEAPIVEKFAAPAATTVGGIMAAAGIASASGEPNDETTPAVVPEIVRDSQKLAHIEPEASAVEKVVEAKREFEDELKRETHQLAPVTLDVKPAVEPTPVHHAVVEPIEPVIEVPVIVQKSLAESGAAPEAAGIAEAVELKKVVEEELKEEAKPIETETLAPPKVENGAALNGNGTSAKSEKSEKSEKETEANGNGTKSPKKSFENGDAGELKKSKRKSFFGSLKDKFFHSGTGAKDKGKAKGEISP